MKNLLSCNDTNSHQNFNVSYYIGLYIDLIVKFKKKKSKYQSFMLCINLTFTKDKGRWIFVKKGEEVQTKLYFILNKGLKAIEKSLFK